MAGFRAHRRVAALFATVAMVVGAGLTVTAPSQAAEGDPVITWPSTTALNPTTSTYSVTVAYDGPEFLFLVVSPRVESGWVAQPLPANGTVDVTFQPEYDGTYDLAVRRCPNASFESLECTQVGEWRSVSVYDDLVAEVRGRELRGPATPFTIDVEPYGEADYDVDWEIVRAGQPDAAPLVSGVEHVVARNILTLSLPAIGASGALVHRGQYRFQATLRTDRDPFGALDGTVATEFEWDSVNAMRGIRLDVHDEFLGETIRNAGVVYPSADPSMDWRDRIYVAVLKDAPEVMKRLEMTVTNADGDVVVAHNGISWNGRDVEQRVVPEGIYTVSLTGVDHQGNAETYTRDIRVSHEILAQMTKEWTLSPKRTMVDKFVGRCASIEVPARASWRGSIGLRSNASGRRCRTIEAQSVSTVHGIYLPDSPLGRHHLYDRMQVLAYGGGAPRAKSAYLVHWYWSRSKQWVGRKQFDRQLGWHGGSRVVGSNVVLRDSGNGRFYVLWSVGLAEGAKYDVKSFKIRFRYWGLRPPRN